MCDLKLVLYRGQTEEEEEMEWVKMFDLSDLEMDDASWGFVPPSTHLTDFTELPIIARPGDYDLDTLTDVLIVVQANIKG